MSTLDALWQVSAQRFAARPALVWGEQEQTYQDLNAAIERLAARLAGEVTAGQRVGILAGNTPALIIGMLAAWRRGAVVLPLNVRWREYELRRILHDAEPTALLALESHRGYSFAELFAALIPDLPSLRRCFFFDPLGELKGEVAGPATAEPEPLDPEIGVLLYTSGTTGLPKGALVKHSRELAGIENVRQVLGMTPEDVDLFVIPITHAFGLTMFLTALGTGSRAVLVESTFSMAPMVEAVRRHRVTVLHGSPALFTSLLKFTATGLATLRTGFVAGSACPPEVLEQLDEAGFRILNLYGMTEIGAATCCRADDAPRTRAATVGRPLPGYEVRIHGSAVGEVQVRGPHVTPGYYRQPEQTTAAFEEGWFRTGDVGSLDAQGNLAISGRAKEVIHVGGLNVFPAEVEGLLLTHADVVHAAIVGLPHATMGEVVQAFVVLRPGSALTAPALLQFARARIAGYKLPYGIRMLPELPLLASGKPDRAALARLAQEEQHAAADQRSQSPL